MTRHSAQIAAWATEIFGRWVEKVEDPDLLAEWVRTILKRRAKLKGAKQQFIEVSVPGGFEDAVGRPTTGTVWFLTRVDHEVQQPGVLETTLTLRASLEPGK